MVVSKFLVVRALCVAPTLSCYIYTNNKKSTIVTLPLTSIIRVVSTRLVVWTCHISRTCQFTPTYRVSPFIEIRVVDDLRRLADFGRLVELRRLRPYELSNTKKFSRDHTVKNRCTKNFYTFSQRKGMGGDTKCLWNPSSGYYYDWKTPTFVNYAIQSKWGCCSPIPRVPYIDNVD